MNLAATSSLALQGALQDGFCNGVGSSDVAKLGELASFHCCQQGFMLSGKGVYLLSHIFICLVFSIRNAEESPEAFCFKCLYMPLCLCCQSSALAFIEDGYSQGWHTSAFTAETVQQKYFLPVLQKYLSPLFSAFMVETRKIVNCFPVNINIPVLHVMPAPTGYLHPTLPTIFPLHSHKYYNSTNTPTTKASTRLQTLPLITFQQIST